MNPTANLNAFCAAGKSIARGIRKSCPGIVHAMLLTVGCWFAATSIASATVVTLAQYRAGENDPGATAGGSANSTTIDYSMNGFDATRTGSALYSSSTPYAISTLSLDFPGSGNNYSAPVVTTAQNNWGLEAWFNFDTIPADNRVVFYNGNASNSGFGLLTRVTGGITRWHTLIGGLNFGDTNIPVTTGWQHVAAVRDNGVLSLYLNGVQVGNTFTTTPNVPAGSLSFGNIDGKMDELRVFSFNPGEFNPTTDLLYYSANLAALLPVPAPEPASALLVGCGVLLLAGRRRKMKNAVH